MTVSMVVAQNGQTEPIGRARELVKNRIVVRSRAGVGTSSLDGRIKALGGAIRPKTVGSSTRPTAEDVLAEVDVKVVEVSPDNHESTLNDLAKRTDVRFAAPVYRYFADAVPNDPNYGNQYHHGIMGHPSSWDITTGASSITVAVLDTGVNSSHADLSANMLAGYNFYSNNTDSSDVHGHGTAVAGCAAAIGNNGIGVAGVAWRSKILPIRISDANGSAYSDTIAAAIKWAADRGAKVINCSFGPLQGDTVIESAAAYARSAGALVFVSAGNDGTREPSPMSPNIIYVSATDASDALTSWSTYGPNVKLSAPGNRIQTTNRSGGYSYFSGTSFSSPVAAGAAALVWSTNPALTNAQVEELLRSNAKDLGAAGYDERYGYGRVDTLKAVQAAVVMSGGNLSANATMSSPAAGSTLSGSSVTFTWQGGVGAQEYWLSAGPASGTGTGNAYFDQSVGTSLSRTVSGLPVDGQALLVRLWTRNSSGWSFLEYRYTAARLAPSAITSPTPGSTLGGSAVTFSWTASTGAWEYWLSIGTSSGGTNIHNASAGTATSVAVGGLPIDGRTLHARLYTLQSGVWQWSDATFTAAQPSPAVLTSPTAGTTLSAATTFSWSAGSAVSEYWISVGDRSGGLNFYNGSTGTSRSIKISTIPMNGAPVYVRIWSKINGDWPYNDYQFRAGIATPPRLSFPVPGTALPSSALRMSWTAGQGIAEYWLSVGSTPGGYDYYYQSTGTAPYADVTGLPMNGAAIYVRLWWRVGSVWSWSDHTVTAAAPGVAALLSPLPGSILPSSSATFSWSEAPGATAYWLYVCSSPGGSGLADLSTGAGRSATVSNLPADGRPLYVRVWTQIGGDWLYRDSVVTANSPIWPVPRTTLGVSETITWNLIDGAEEYWLSVGSTPGGTDYANGSTGLARSLTVSTLPTDGSTVYVRLWYRIGASWPYLDFTYIAGGSN